MFNNMRITIWLSALIFCAHSTLSATPITLTLKDGSVIQGDLELETDQTYQVNTPYGRLTIDKANLQLSAWRFSLKDGNQFVGQIQQESEQSYHVQTAQGTLEIFKSQVANMVPMSKPNTQPIQKAWQFSQEQLIDVFFDPTAHTLPNNTLYFSGLSFGFGINDKWQVSSRWADYFQGNFNIRPKYQFFQRGNWAQSFAASVGGHLHSNWQSHYKRQWQSGSSQGKVCQWDEQSGQDSCEEDTWYWGRYTQPHETVQIERDSRDQRGSP